MRQSAQERRRSESVIVTVLLFNVAGYLDARPWPAATADKSLNNR
jgi:hypothetical protein